jgi:hypothetical protein
MKAFPERYRIPVLAGAILVLLLVVAALAGQKPPAPSPEQAMMPESATGTEAMAPTSTTATTTKTAPAPAPAKKPAAKAPTTQTAPQTVTNPTQLGRAPTIVSDQLKLSVLLSKYGADLTWTTSFSKTLKGYVVVKSTTDSNPYYPKEAWSMFRNADTGNYTWQDRNIEHGKTTYYRVCALMSDDSVQCGNVATANYP